MSMCVCVCVYASVCVSVIVSVCLFLCPCGKTDNVSAFSQKRIPLNSMCVCVCVYVSVTVSVRNQNYSKIIILMRKEKT